MNNYLWNKLSQLYDTLTLELSGCFDLNAVATAFPIQIVSTGLKDILVPIKNAQLLQDLQPNFEKLSYLVKSMELLGCIFLLCLKNIICRILHLYDIDEEAATGTSNGALACYLYHHQILQKPLHLCPRLYLKRSFRSLSAFEHYTSKDN